MNRTWVKVVFVASLVLNLFLIGAAAGVLALGARMARDRPQGGGPPPGGMGQLARATMVLPPAERQAFRQALRREGESMRPQGEANRRARQEAWLVGDRDNYDANAVKAALARARVGDQAARARVEEKVVDLASALPPPQRRAFYRAMGAPPPPRPFRRPFGPRRFGPPPGEYPDGPPGMGGPPMGPPGGPPMGHPPGAPAGKGELAPPPGPGPDTDEP